MKVLVFRDGREKPVTGEQGKYWLCGEERYRRLSPSISDVREENPTPKKKAAKKKKEATGGATDGDCGK